MPVYVSQEGLTEASQSPALPGHFDYLMPAEAFLFLIDIIPNLTQP